MFTTVNSVEESKSIWLLAVIFAGNKLLTYATEENHVVTCVTYKSKYESKKISWNTVLLHKIPELVYVAQ